MKFKYIPLVVARIASFPLKFLGLLLRIGYLRVKGFNGHFKPPTFRRRNDAESNYDWAISDGGPHLLLPTELLTVWEGVSPPSGGRVGSRSISFFGKSRLSDYRL